jgi:hypothetical protein
MISRLRSVASMMAFDSVLAGFRLLVEHSRLGPFMTFEGGPLRPSSAGRPVEEVAAGIAVFAYESAGLFT